MWSAAAASSLALAWAVGAAPALAAAPAAPAPEVKASTAAATPPQVKPSTPTVSVTTIYSAERLRDPFQKASASGPGGLAGRVMAPEDFNIHNLSLRGIMKDSAADYALFSDSAFGASFIFRKGRLFDQKGKPVPGVTGTLNLKQKTVNLMTQDKDVQVFRLGEEITD